MPRPRLLGVLLCYNDGDFLDDSIQHLLDANHDVIAWNHGSTDETAEVLRRRARDLVEVRDVPREVDFYDMYPLMSRHLLSHYVTAYDWISWPDQDEILEGPTRAARYQDFLVEAFDSPHAWIEFNDFVFWYTEADDSAIASPVARLRHYARARQGPPKIRSWRASATNIRWFNHNRAEGSKFPRLFNLRHYPMRSEAQMQRRIAVDRAGLQFGPVNYHYENMKQHVERLRVDPRSLYLDDGRSELNPSMTFDWSQIYGRVPTLPAEVNDSYLLSTRKWQISATLHGALATAATDAASDRMQRWAMVVDRDVQCPIAITLERSNASIITRDLAREWEVAPAQVEAVVSARAAQRHVEATLGAMTIRVSADATERSVQVLACDAQDAVGGAPLVALVPYYGGDVLRVAPLECGRVAFRDLTATHYFLIAEPSDDPPHPSSADDRR